jgi:16S rRNA C967 or C1407 C5-methylase (RsmB/RsmF family)
MCAAPGGKTIVIASRMDEAAELLSNERSFERRMRLQKSCDSCLPPQIRERVRVINKDGATLCLSNDNIEFFDAILLDAPCSSERHVLGDKKYLAEWSPARIKTLAMAQWSLVSSAWRMLKKGGYLLYSTCALNETENDGIIEKLLKKFPDAQIVEPNLPDNPDSADNIMRFAADLPEYEKTRFGSHILPDAACGAGPIFFSLLKKAVSETKI